MSKFVKPALLAAVILVALFTMTGCFSISVDELYSIPEASDEYLKLEQKIGEVLSAGAEYSPPTAGPNRQSVQLKDIDGDGEAEAIAFFATQESPKVYVFKKDGDDYTVANIIEGIGTAVESVRYVDMSGDGTLEIVIGWQMGAALQNLEIYSLRGFSHVRLYDSVDYNSVTVCDLTGDGRDDVIAIKLPGSETAGEALLLSLMEDDEVVPSRAPLSTGVEAISNIVQGNLRDGKQAVFVECRYDGSMMLTDVLTWKNGELTNVTIDAAAGTSAQTLRTMSLNSSDLDKDGVIEMPFPRAVVTQTETPYYVTDWKTFGSTGTLSYDFTTYHNYTDKWYLRFPESWGEEVTVRRQSTVSGERTIVFSYAVDEETFVDFLKIYVLSGDNKEDRAKIGERFIITEENSQIFAAEMLKGAEDVDVELSATLIEDNFSLIYGEWAQSSQ